MENLGWNDGMSVGIESIDNDHKKIFSIIAKIIDASHDMLTDELLNDIFSDLEYYAQSHFHREELLMEKIGYKHLQLHKQTHNKFIEKIPELKAQLLTNNSYDVAEEINLFLHHWLIDHILVTDMDYASDYYHYKLKNTKDSKAADSTFFQQVSQWLCRHFTLTQRIFISALLPIIGLLILSFMILKDNYQLYTNVKALAEISPIVAQINTLTHSLQLERGLSTGLISSNYQQFYPELVQRRQATDQLFKLFFVQLERQSKKLLFSSSSLMKVQFNSKNEHNNFFDIALLKQDLSLIIKQRKQIDKQQGSITQLKSSYTQFIRHLLAIQRHLAHINMDTKLANSIIAISAILNFKEILGQERALGTAIIEQSNADIKKLNRANLFNRIKLFNTLHGQNHFLLESFYYSASEDQKYIFGSFSINELIDGFLDEIENYIETGKSTSYSDKQWFDSISLKVNELKIISDKLIVLLDQQLEQQLAYYLKRYYLIMFILLVCIAINILFLLILNYSIINPIQHITSALNKITSGDKSQQFYNHFAHDEMTSIHQAYEKLRRKLLQSDIAEDIIRQQNESIELRKGKQKYYRELATIDSLTGAINRRSFDEIIDTEIKQLKLGDHKLSIMMLDIDYFKKVNDKYGHAIGDEVLKGFYQICYNIMRASDLIARIGGEEFSIIMPQTSLAQATIFAERLREVIEKTAIDQNKSINITVSIGVVEWNNNSFKNKSDFLKYADDLLYKAKHSGRNCVTTSL
ncbi:MAG: bacteriohemerythrin [Pseudomonadota bacterium]